MVTTQRATIETKDELHQRKMNVLAKFVDALLASPEGKDVAKVILFGSSARGEAEEDSDIDVLLLAARDTERLNDVARSIALPMLLDLGEVDVFVAPMSYWFAPNSYFVQSVIENGVEVSSMPEKEMEHIMSLHFYYLAVDYYEAAQISRNTGHWRVAVDAGYNAIELAMKAFLVGQVKEMPNRHGSINRLFGQIYVVARQKFSHDFGSHLNPALELRNKARYVYEAKIDEEDVKFVFGVADEILAQLKDYVLTLKGDPDEQKDNP
ncbi:MAG: HEPN domain-containing protein [Chloroflexota bacterium]